VKRLPDIAVPTLLPINVEEVTTAHEPKQISAGASAELLAYHARKRVICVRTLIFLAPLVALAALRDPVASVQLALGGGLGVLNMLAVMRQNERLVEGRSSRAVFVLNAQVRVFAVGILPAAVAFRLGQFWTVGLYFLGFFLPLALYAIEYRRSIQRKL
jgi:hypothetical protein